MTRSLIPAALVSVAFAAALAAWEAFAPHTHPPGEQTPGGEEHAIGEYLIVLGIIGVGALVVFGWVVRRGLRKESAAWTALALSLLGLLSVAAFWSGLPPVLAAGGILLGWASRDGSPPCWAAWGAIGIGVFVLMSDLILYVTGMT